MNKVLLDTNLLIYAIDEESKYFTPAQTLLTNKNVDLFTTSKNITEFLTVITRLPEKSLNMDDALTVVDDYKTILHILYPSELSFSIFLNLLKKYRPVGLQIHDFEIISIGLAYQITQVATFNRKDFETVKEISIYSIESNV